MNTVVRESTSCSAAYLTFARELRTLDDTAHDFRSIVESETFVPQRTFYLPVSGVPEKHMKPPKIGTKYMQIRKVATTENPTLSLGKYHVSALIPYAGEETESPVVALKKRGQPKKPPSCSGSLVGPSSKPEGEIVTHRVPRPRRAGSERSTPTCC
ncbi:hypothetical protein ILUMI_20130 [Ignelater luminosus]|uniref:Uncharacterized protein n=1 Tax=Ignelater luminosus TaxID=2038154 RepID=A0A8K0CEV3_IGNLU|nr:hypothetical protein ILUMI_20130 [Ignelater luminosus]